MIHLVVFFRQEKLSSSEKAWETTSKVKTHQLSARLKKSDTSTVTPRALKDLTTIKNEPPRHFFKKTEVTQIFYFKIFETPTRAFDQFWKKDSFSFREQTVSISLVKSMKVFLFVLPEMCRVCQLFSTVFQRAGIFRNEIFFLDLSYEVMYCVQY